MRISIEKIKVKRKELIIEVSRIIQANGNEVLKKGTYSLEFTTRCKDRFPIIETIAMCMKNNKGEERRCSGTILLELVGGDMTEYNEKVYNLWYSVTDEDRLGKGGIFTLYRIEDGKRVLEKDINFRKDFAEALFQRKKGHKKADKSLFWLGNYENTKIEINQSRVNDSNLPAEIEGIVSTLTNNFIGREYVFTAIDKFLENEEAGYFTLIGDPGEGKSAIMAEFVRRNICPAFFVNRSQGNNTSDLVYDSIQQQLKSLYGLSNNPKAQKELADVVTLESLIWNLQEKLQRQEKIIIVIDGLDEASAVNRSAGQNILGLPTYLPKNVYLIVSRRDEWLPMVTHSQHRIFDLRDHRDECTQDIENFLIKSVEKPALIQKIREWKISTNDFVERLKFTSEYNFMYLHYVIPELECGVYNDFDLSKLPVGLKGYYEDHWEKMGMRDNPLPKTKIKVIYVFTEIRTPVTVFLIADILKLDVMKVQSVLDEWEQFYHKNEKENNSFYSIYHQSFLEFLHRKDIIKACGISLKEINADIADELWNGLVKD